MPNQLTKRLRGCFLILSALLLLFSFSSMAQYQEPSPIQLAQIFLLSWTDVNLGLNLTSLFETEVSDGGKLYQCAILVARGKCEEAVIGLAQLGARAAVNYLAPGAVEMITWLDAIVEYSTVVMGEDYSSLQPVQAFDNALRNLIVSNNIHSLLCDALQTAWERTPAIVGGIVEGSLSLDRFIDELATSFDSIEDVLVDKLTAALEEVLAQQLQDSTVECEANDAQELNPINQIEYGDWMFYSNFSRSSSSVPRGCRIQGGVLRCYDDPSPLYEEKYKPNINLPGEYTEFAFIVEFTIYDYCGIQALEFCFNHYCFDIERSNRRWFLADGTREVLINDLREKGEMNHLVVVVKEDRLLIELNGELMVDRRFIAHSAPIGITLHARGCSRFEVGFDMLGVAEVR